MKEAKETITVLIVEPVKKPYVKEIENTLSSLQCEVGGYIQAVYPWQEPCAIICDEEGKVKCYEPNRALRDEDGHIYDIVAGTFLIVGLGDDCFTSLSEEYINRFTEMFSVPEMFIRTRDKLVVVPMECSGNNA